MCCRMGLLRAEKKGFKLLAGIAAMTAAPKPRLHLELLGNVLRPQLRLLLRL